MPSPLYRGRFAPSPTGYLHLGHARTFWIAQERSRAHAGTLIFRNEDLDPVRSKPEFAEAMVEDLRWLGLSWEEGPDIGGPFAPYAQSQRLELYRKAFEQLRNSGALFACTCSRKDVLRALEAPHQGEEEPIYPGTCRCNSAGHTAANANWRFRVPEAEAIEFVDGFFGEQRFIAGRDFGDFVVWRNDGVPSYQLAVVVDDATMQITEVVRGADLLLSTARQLLLYRALGLKAPAFFHCPLVVDSSGNRLAKRHDALSVRTLRSQGLTAEELRARFSVPEPRQVEVSPRVV